MNNDLPLPHPAGTQAQLWKAAVLALVAGYVDAFAFVNYKVYASFMSGNTTQTGLQTGQQNLAAAALDLLPIPAFVAGVVVGTLLLHSNRNHRLAWLFSLVASLLVSAMAVFYQAPLPGWLVIILLSLAMGIMNTGLTCVGGQAISLGYVSGDLNSLGQHLALAIRRSPLPHAQGPWDTHGRRAALLAGIWSAFLIGAGLAGAVTSQFAVWTLLPPVVALVVLAALDRTSKAGATTA